MNTDETSESGRLFWNTEATEFTEKGRTEFPFSVSSVLSVLKIRFRVRSVFIREIRG